MPTSSGQVALCVRPVGPKCAVQPYYGMILVVFTPLLPHRSDNPNTSSSAADRKYQLCYGGKTAPLTAVLVQWVCVVKACGLYRCVKFIRLQGRTDRTLAETSPPSSSAQDSIFALGKAQMRSTSFVTCFPSVA